MQIVSRILATPDRFRSGKSWIARGRPFQFFCNGDESVEIDLVGVSKGDILTENNFRHNVSLTSHMLPLPTNARPSLLRQLNEKSILQTLQAKGPLSRAELTRLTGISGPTVTRAILSLLEARLVEEEESKLGLVGRPGKIVRLARSGVTLVGVVVGSRVCEIVRGNLEGHLHPDDHILIPTGSSYEELIEAIADPIRTWRTTLSEEILSVGVSLPGLFDSRAARSIASPNVPLTNGQFFGEDLRAALGGGLDVTVLQECDGLGLAEQLYGGARGESDFAILDISDGMGLGVVEHGKLLEGHSGLAGEIGHVTVNLSGRRCGCGNLGCLETEATDNALLTRVSERLSTHHPKLVPEGGVTMPWLREAVTSGRVDVSAELPQLSTYLSVAMSAVINIFNPRRLFVYGECFDLQSDLFEKTIVATRQRTLRPSMDDCEILRTRANKQLGALAAAIHPLTQRHEPAA